MSETEALLGSRKKLLEILHKQGIRDLDVLAAMQVIPRERFLPEDKQKSAYHNVPLPIGFQQTISQPYIIGRMTEVLEVKRENRVLEIGTGSGYQTAILARLAQDVFTIERFDELSQRAQQTLGELGFTNIHFRVGDGTLGWPEEAPFDRILVTACGPEVPLTLSSQLADGGRLVMPIQSKSTENQALFLFEKVGGELEPRFLGGCRFVPLVGLEGFPANPSESEG